MLAWSLIIPWNESPYLKWAQPKVCWWRRSYPYAIQAANDGFPYVWSCFLFIRDLFQLIYSFLEHFICPCITACVKMVYISSRAHWTAMCVFLFALTAFQVTGSPRLNFDSFGFRYQKYRLYLTSPILSTLLAKLIAQWLDQGN